MCSTGLNANTHTAIIIVVTIEDTAIDIVDITSPSSVFGSTSALSIAFSATGSFRFVMLPVTNPRYVPPVPNRGEYVRTSNTAVG